MSRPRVRWWEVLRNAELEGSWGPWGWWWKWNPSVMIFFHCSILVTIVPLQLSFSLWTFTCIALLFIHSLICSLVVYTHCKTHGAWKSYPGLAIYMIYLCTPEVGKSFPSHPFMRDILYPCGWKIIHLCEIYCTLRVWISISFILQK